VLFAESPLIQHFEGGNHGDHTSEGEQQARYDRYDCVGRRTAEQTPYDAGALAVEADVAA
jgi:hypothetical protein